VLGIASPTTGAARSEPFRCRLIARFLGNAKKFALAISPRSSDNKYLALTAPHFWAARIV
jgi:hypothetical protein